MEEKFRKFVAKFVKEHIDEVENGKTGDDQKYLYQDLGDFTSRANMLYCIKNNTEDAGWAFEELMKWGMRTDYTSQYEVALIVRNGCPQSVYHIDGIGYFTLDKYDEFKPVVKKEKIIEVFEIEE